MRRAIAQSQAETAGRGRPRTGRRFPANCLGASPAMQQVFKRIAFVAPSEVPVLITGESGTGKELVARAIHRHSLLASSPLLSVNLAALESHAGGERAVRACPRRASPGRRPPAAACWNWATGPPCSSTKSATSLPACRSSCCACWNSTK